MSTPVQYQCKAARAASGALSSTLSSACAAPLGLRLPCSQLRTVSSETLMRRENSAWLKPRRLRIRRAYRAASCMASASSAAMCRAMSSSVVASTPAASIQAVARVEGSLELILLRTVVIAFDLPLICFACRNDANQRAAQCVNNDIQAPFDHAYQSETLFTVVVPRIWFDDPVWIGKGECGVVKVEPTRFCTRLALGFILFKIHGASVGLRTTFCKSGGAL